MSDPHASHPAPVPEKPEPPAAHVRTIAAIFKWMGALVGLFALGFAITWSWSGGSCGIALWAIFLALYGGCIWYGNRKTLHA